jgi:hypothetical protein
MLIELDDEEEFEMDSNLTDFYFEGVFFLSGSGLRLTL